MNPRPDLGADPVARHLQVVGRLHTHPELGAGPEIAGKPQSSIGCDCALAVDDRADANLRDRDRLGERVLREIKRLQEILAQDFAGMSWSKVGHNSNLLDDSRRLMCP